MVAAKKGKITSPDGKVVMYVDDDSYTKMVHTADCELFVHPQNVNSVKLTGDQYIIGGASNVNLMKVTPVATLTTGVSIHPRRKLRWMVWKDEFMSHNAEEDLKRLKDKVWTLQGETVDSELHSDLVDIMKENADEVRKAYPEISFSRLFWNEQLKAASAKDPRQVRWHLV